MEEKPRRMTSTQANDALFARAIQVLQNPLYDPEGEDFKVITSVLKSCDFFQKNFKSPAKLNDFLQLAKFHLNYEFHNYGSVLIKEKDYADRFYFILQGNVQKFHQRPSYDVDHEVKEEKQRKQRKLISGRRPSHARKSILGHLKVAKANSVRRSRRFSRIPPSSPSTGNTGPSGFSSRSSKLYTEEGSPKQHVPSLFAKRKKSKLSATPKSPYKSPAKPLLKTSESSPHRRRSSIKHSGGLAPPKMTDRIRLTINTGLRASIFQKEKAASPTKTPKTPKTRKSNSQSPSLKSDNSPLSPYRKDSIIPLKTNKRPTALHLKHLKSPKLLNVETLDEAEGPISSSPYTKIPREEAKLIRYIASRNRDIQHRCLYENAIRMAKINTFNRGDFFGENFHKTFQPKETSILAVSSPEAHLLSLTRESYQVIISEIEKKANDKLQMFLNLFPKFNGEVVLNFSQYFVEQSFQVDEVIYRENDPTKDLFLLLSGNVKLLSGMGMKGLKTTEDSDHQATTTLPSLNNEIKIPVVSVIKNQFFGEEVLLESEFRQFTAVANSPNTIVYYLEISLYEKMKKEYESLFEVLKSQANEKFAWRQYKTIEARQKKALESTSPSKPILAYTSKQVYSPTGFSYIMPWRDTPSKKRNFSEASVSLSLRASDAEPAGQGQGGAAVFTTPRSDQKSMFTATSSPRNGAFETMYKQKFSRAHVPAARQAHLTVIGSPRKGDMGAAMPVKFDIEEFNVRKELGNSKSHRAFTGKELLDLNKKKSGNNEFLSSYRSPNSTMTMIAKGEGGFKQAEGKSPSLVKAWKDLVLPPGIQALKNKGMKPLEKSEKLNKIKCNSISMSVHAKHEGARTGEKKKTSARKKNDLQLLTIYSFPKVQQRK